MNPLPQMIESILPMRALCFARGMAQRIRSVVQGEVRPVQADFRMPVLYSRGAVLGGLAVLLGAGSVGAVDIAQFAPNPLLAEYSVYATDSIQMPANFSGTASGGAFGTGSGLSSPSLGHGGIYFGNSVALRSPLLTANGGVSWGSIQGGATLTRMNILGQLTAGGTGGTNNYDGLVQVGDPEVE